MPRRIGVVSVGRSDRGHLAPLLALLPDARVHRDQPSPLHSDPFSIAVEFGRVVEHFTVEFSYKPDLVVIFGDRWEQLAAATAAMILGIPIAHLHAGETTEAVIDDACRGAISAMATIHIAAAEYYAMKLLRQGYKRTYCLGAPGLVRLPRAKPISLPTVLVQFHPETRNLADIPRQVNELMEGIADIEASFLITEPGMDVGRDEIMKSFAGQFSHFTDEEWMMMLATSHVLVGNSSCGIIETPSIPLASVNIGDRQKGRLMASSVIQAPHSAPAIRAAIELALDPEWRAKNLTGENPYGDRGAAQRIADFLLTCAL